MDGLCSIQEIVMEANKTNKLKQLCGQVLNLWPAVLTGAVVFATIANTTPILHDLPARLSLPTPEPVAPTPEPYNPGFTDGVYTGHSNGFGGEIYVEVTVEGGMITNIEILDAEGETKNYFAHARRVMTYVMKEQTWEVDTVSGSTYSSRGILGAIKNAITGEEVINPSPPKTKPASELVSTEFVEPGSYADGTYPGSAMGFGGLIEVEVTVVDGKISDIKIISASGETGAYFNRARSVVDAVLASGSVNVDLVSGATYSSNGILNAIKNALRQGVQEEEEIILRNGVYDIVGTCQEEGIFDYDIEMTMVVEDNKIVSLEAKKTNDRSPSPEENNEYFSLASNLLSKIKETRKTDGIDIASGATITSKTMIEGSEKLLEYAKNPSFIDGEYKTSTTCKEQDTFAYTIDIDMQVSDGNVTDIDITKNNDLSDDPSFNQTFLNHVARECLEAIITRQSCKGLDSVTGATYSYDAMTDGIDILLEQASIRKKAAYTDGVYEAEGICSDDDFFDYTIKVIVTIENSRIKDIQVLKSEDLSDDPEINDRYLGFAVNGRGSSGIVEQVIDRQNVDQIDIVSGATYSSNTIISTLQEAMKDAMQSEETQLAQ